MNGTNGMNGTETVTKAEQQARMEAESRLRSQIHQEMDPGTMIQEFKCGCRTYRHLKGCTSEPRSHIHIFLCTQHQKGFPNFWPPTFRQAYALAGRENLLISASGLDLL